MSGAAPKDIRSVWVAKAQELDGQDYFARYSPKRRSEVLKKGFLGKRSPDEVIRLAKQEVGLGHARRTPKFNDEMRDHFHLAADEIREAVLAILDEVPPDSYKPPRELDEPPGCPFIFFSNRLRSKIYLKIQIAGDDKRPQVLLRSCHPPVY